MGKNGGDCGLMFAMFVVLSDELLNEDREERAVGGVEVVIVQSACGLARVRSQSRETSSRNVGGDVIKSNCQNDGGGALWRSL